MMDINISCLFLHDILHVSRKGIRMSTWTKKDTISNKMELPYRFTCLYCGKENHGTVKKSYSKTVEVKFVSHKVGEAEAEFARKEAEAMSGINGKLETWESNLRDSVGSFLEYWKGCVDGIVSDRTSPFAILMQCQCEHCREQQPYSLGKRYKSKLKTPSLALLIAGFALLLISLILFFVFLGNHNPTAEQSSLKTVTLCLFICGIIAAAFGFFLLLRAEREHAKMQYIELQRLPYEPEKVIKFD